jgi:hypothetical protein
VGLSHSASASASSALFYTTYNTVLYCTIFYCNMLCCTALYHIVLYCTILDNTMPYCILMFYTTLYYTMPCPTHFDYLCRTIFTNGPSQPQISNFPTKNMMKNNRGKTWIRTIDIVFILVYQILASTSTSISTIT